MMAAVEVEEIPREPARPPQVFRTVLRHGDEFDMLEEEEASAEVNWLRTNLSAMMAQIEVSKKTILSLCSY
jgi:hypothetical protein